MDSRRDASSDAGSHGGPRSSHGNDAKIELTPDDMRVLRRCNTESFWYRSFPLAAGFSVLAHLGVKNGYLRPNARFGSTPKILLATVVGYVIGKFSYRQRCAEMIMELPNSQLADALRRNRDMSSRPWKPSEELSVPVDTEPSEEHFAGVKRRRPSQTQLGDSFSIEKPDVDDYRRPDLDLTEFQERPPDVPQSFPAYDADDASRQPSTLTYDELRRRNREEYEARRYEHMKRGASGGQFGPPPSRSRAEPHEPDSFSGSLADTKPKDGVKNNYGDVWDK